MTQRLRPGQARRAESLVYRALADPTRRELLVLLARDGEQAAGALAQPFRISRPAVSKHLAVLRRAGLVEERRAGRELLYRLRAEPLHDVAAWLDRMERFWQQRLGALGAHLEKKD